MILNRLFEEGFHGKVIFGAKCEGGKEVDYLAMWGMDIPGRRIS